MIHNDSTAMNTNSYRLNIYDKFSSFKFCCITIFLLEIEIGQSAPVELELELEEMIYDAGKN